MQEIASRPSNALGQIALAEHDTRASSRRLERRSTSVTSLWHESMRVLAAHSGPVFVLALVGFAGAGIIGQLANSALTFDGYVRTGSYFSAFFNNLQVQYLAQAIFGTFALAFARGALTWIALRHETGERITLGAACRAALARWPALLLSSVVYGVLVLAGIAGLSLLLRELRVDLSNLGRIGSDYGGISYAVKVRAIGALIPDPGSPFSELLNYVRILIRRSSVAYTWFAFRYVESTASSVWLIGLAGVAWIILVDTLLRMRSAAVMNPDQGSFLRAMIDSVRMGACHFGPVFAHAWLVRGVIFIVSVLFVITPMTIAQGLIVTFLVRTAGSFWPYPASQLVFAVGSSLVLMVFAAFSAVYDARQYLAIRAQASSSAKPDQ